MSALKPAHRSAFKNRRDAHAARGAYRNQSTLGLGLIENFRQRRDYSPTGGGEWMPDGEAASLHVQFGSVNRPQSSRQLKFVAAIRGVRPGLQGAQHLAGERLVYFVEIKVLKLQLRIAQHAGNC